MFLPVSLHDSRDNEESENQHSYRYYFLRPHWPYRNSDLLDQ